MSVQRKAPALVTDIKRTFCTLGLLGLMNGLALAGPDDRTARSRRFAPLPKNKKPCRKAWLPNPT